MAKKTEELFEEIVNDFKEELKNGGNPFAKLKKVFNANTKRLYTGFNAWHLSGYVASKGYSDSRFATFNQIKDAGGYVKKGEKGVPVFFWSSFFNFKNNISVPASSLDDAVKKAQQKDSSIKRNDLVSRVPFMKHFTVYNLEQSEGANFDVMENSDFVSIEDILQSSEANMKIGNIPYYDEESDTIFYSNEEKLLSLTLHAVSKSTNKENRMKRDVTYQEDELICTITASFLALSIGKDIDMAIEQSLVSEWLDILEKKPSFLYKAASNAYKVYDNIVDNIKKTSKRVA